MPKLFSAETVYLPEGERDVHTLEAWGLVASCNSGGSGSSHLYAGWTNYFRDRHIVILPDNDGPGRKHAAAVAAALLNVAASIRIVELPGLPTKGDVTDWRDAGGTRERFLELTKAAAMMDAAALSEWRARWGLADEEPHQARSESGDWRKPAPIQSELPPVQTFSEDLLPDSFRPLVADVTDRMQVPMDYPAVAMVLCLAGAVNRRAVIQPKVNDTGRVTVPNLWGGIIAPPGFMKSPVIQAATRPLNQIQADWRREHEEALKDYEAEKEKCELRRSAWSKYRSLMPSLALLFELAERAVFDVFDGAALAHSENFVSLEDAKRAAAWCEYLESHARRVYSCVVTRQLRAARDLAEKVKHQKVGADGFFSCRDVYTKGWSGLDSSGRVDSSNRPPGPEPRTQ